MDFHEIETSESMRLKNLFRDGDLRHLFHQNPGDQSRRVTDGLLSCQNSDGLKAAEKNKKECRALFGMIKSSLEDQLWSVRGGTACLEAILGSVSSSCMPMNLMSRACRHVTHSMVNLSLILLLAF